LPGGEASSEALGMTDDGGAIVGRASSGLGKEAFLWTQVGGLRGLGDLTGGGFESRALDVSSGGRRIVGAGLCAEGARAFLWDRVYGMKRLDEALARSAGAALAGWTLLEAVAITSDGVWVAGNGLDPSGQPQGWIARL
jgi:hypothetical protein